MNAFYRISLIGFNKTVVEWQFDLNEQTIDDNSGDQSKLKPSFLEHAESIMINNVDHAIKSNDS